MHFVHVKGQLVGFQNLSTEKDLPHCREVKRVCIAHYFFPDRSASRCKLRESLEGGVRLESIRQSQASLSIYA